MLSEILRSVVFVGSCACLFVGRLVGWFVRSLTSCQRLQWLARAPFLVTHTSCINRVIANSQSKFKIFVTMAIGVGLRQIVLPQLYSSTPKIPWLVQESPTYLVYKPSYSQFSVKISKFSLPWQRGLVWDNFFYHG